MFNSDNEILQDSLIEWSKDNKLTWNDFQMGPVKSIDYGASTNATFHSTFEVKGDTLYFNVVTRFNKSKSWVKSDKKSDHLLKHEQIHFDLTECISRQLREEIATYRFNSLETFTSETKTILAKYKTVFSELHEAYDKESNHSKNELGQDKWNKKIRLMLSESENYSSTSLQVYVGYLFE